MSDDLSSKEVVVVEEPVGPLPTFVQLELDQNNE